MSDETFKEGGLDHKDREARYVAQTTEQFAALGRFVQAFEQMVDAGRIACLQLFPTSGGGAVAIKQQRMIRLLLSQMTAWSIFEQHRAFYMELLLAAGDAVPADERKILGEVLVYIDREVGELVKARNALLHGTWRIGWASAADEDFSELRVHKEKISKQGLVAHSFPNSVVELDVISSRCNAVTELVCRVWMTFCTDSGPRVRYNVHKDDGVWLASPPP